MAGAAEEISATYHVAVTILPVNTELSLRLERSKSAWRWGWLGCALLALACQAGLTFTVTFDEVGGLEAGDAVVYKGRQIGEVGDVTLTRAGAVEVELEIDREYRQTLYREAQFTLERTVTGGYQIAVYDTEGPRTPIEGGEVLRGRPGSLEELMGKVQDLGRDLVTEGAERLNEQIDSWRQWLRESESAEPTDATEEEGTDLLERVGDYADRVATMSREQLERFRREELPELERRAAELRDWLREQGRNGDAERFWRDFRDWVESFDDEQSQPDAEPSEPSERDQG